LDGLKYPLLSDNNGGVALRGLFIIDKQQILRQIAINDLPVGRSVDETLRLIKAFQYVEQHSEVCPADWNEKTNPNRIKPDPVKSKEYFSKTRIIFFSLILIFLLDSFLDIYFIFICVLNIVVGQKSICKRTVVMILLQQPMMNLVFKKELYLKYNLLSKF
jgi:hypothetical protein